MTQQEALQLLPVIQAFSEGQPIQHLYAGKWYDIDSLSLDNPTIYRIKPREPREFTVAMYVGPDDSMFEKDKPHFASENDDPEHWQKIRVREILTTEP